MNGCTVSMPDTAFVHNEAPRESCAPWPPVYGETLKFVRHFYLFQPIEAALQGAWIYQGVIQ